MSIPLPQPIIMPMGDASPTIARVLRGDLCSGCGLCVGIASDALYLETVDPGYTRPFALGPLTAADEAMVEAACPGVRVEPWPEAAYSHPVWGPYIQCLAGHATDENLRHRASSGGALSALLCHSLISGMVDRVLHVEADPVYPTRNRMRWSLTRDEVVSGAGSRYAASSPLADIDKALTLGGRFAFVGKPCDVSALRRLATVDPRVEAHVPVMMSFYCAGLPSHGGADRILARMGIAPADVSKFRYRGFGWPGLTRVETHDGRVKEMRYEDSWGGELSREVQFRCKICPDAVGGVADIACADAWYGDEQGYPQFDEQGGRSLIMSRTSVGDLLLRSAMAAGSIAAEPLPIADIDLMQPGQARRKRLVAARIAACKLAFQPIPKTAGLKVGTAAKMASVSETLKNFVGTFRRIAQGRR